MGVTLDPKYYKSRKILERAKFSETDLEDLNRKNKICSLEQERKRISATLTDLTNEINSLEQGRSTLTSLEAFFSRYQTILEGSQSAEDDTPWLPLCSMLLELLKALSKTSDERVQEAAEANAIHSFLAGAKELGFESPSKKE